MYGWTGTILRVDLTKGKVTREATDIKIGSRLHRRPRPRRPHHHATRSTPRPTPSSPDNKLIFAPGPLTGTFAPSAGRYDVVTKGPLNDVIAASNSGGAFGPELKYAGYDAVIIEGKAAKPVYLWISDDQVEIRDAAAIWGHDTPDTTDLVRAETDEDAKVACIGPAGEHLSLIANIMNEMHRAAGRTGVGAVMGSKNLKAVAVYGTGAVQVADPDALQGRRHEVAQADPGAPRRRRRPQGLRHQRARQHPQPDGRACPRATSRTATSPPPTRPAASRWPRSSCMRPKGCFSCIISCGRVTKVDAPRLQGLRRRPGVRDRLVVRRRLRHRRPRRHHQGQLPLQRVRHRHHLDGLHGGLRHGALRARHHHDQGHRRRAAHVRQRRGHGRDGAQDRRGRGLRRQARPGLVPPGRELRPPRATP